MILDQKQKQFWNRHAKRNNNPRDANVSVLLGAFVSRSTRQPIEQAQLVTVEGPAKGVGQLHHDLAGDSGRYSDLQTVI